MQTQDNIFTKKLTKQEYNRIYYQQNKHRWIDQKKRASSSNVLQLFARIAPRIYQPSLPRQKWISVLRWIEMTLLICLAGAITTFLVREAAHFYLDAQESHLSAYLKAGVVEGVAILFSFSRSRHSFLNWAQKLVVVMLCGFTLWVMSGKIVKSAFHETSKVEITQKILVQMESELKQKEELRSQLLNKGWLGATRRYEKDVDLLRRKIVSLQKDLSFMQPTQVVINGVSILIFFRLLLVIANLICIHRIVEQIDLEVRPKEVKSTVERLNSIST